MVVKLHDAPGTASITINVPNIFIRYIKTQNPNRSEWIKEAGDELLELIEDKILPVLNCDIDESRIVSISKPDNRVLGKIFTLVKKNKLIFSRSEFYRLSIFMKMLSEIENEEKLKKYNADGLEEPGKIKIPIEDENGNHTFKVYKILKKLDY